MPYYLLTSTAVILLIRHDNRMGQNSKGIIGGSFAAALFWFK
jgi:hypothetical protein